MSRNELICHFTSHSIHESDDYYYRLKILSRDDAINYRKSLGFHLLNTEDSYPVGIIKDNRLLALAIAVPRKEDSQILKKEIGSIEWLTIDHSISFNERKNVLLQLLEQCHRTWSQFFDVVTTLIDFDQYDILEALQESGAKIYGGNYTWICQLNKVSESIFLKNSLEKAILLKHEDIPALIECVRQSYATYQSHYHADSHFEKNLCSDTYLSEVKKHIGNNGQVIIVKNDKGGISGFSTINPHHGLNNHFKKNLVGEMGIVGVSPSDRGRNIHETTVIRCLELFKKMSFIYAVIASKADNYIVQSTWIRLGFLPKNFRYRFHWWLR
jgi:predicted acetyltransferase